MRLRPVRGRDPPGAVDTPALWSIARVPAGVTGPHAQAVPLTEKLVGDASLLV
jgi:hypothetical protein